ncbi:MAG: hypothetical protein R3F59_34965 [Myxococcota bacterium]
MILVSLAPLRGLTVWLQGRIAVRAGVALRQRLLVGALRMSPDDVRTRGVGTLLGRVEESAALERLALDGGLGAVLSALSSGRWPRPCCGRPGRACTRRSVPCGSRRSPVVALAMYRARAAWTAQRVDSTHALVEKLLGHRTRVVQDAPARWHDAEDQALARYADASRRADRSTLLLVAVTAAWTTCGIAALAPSFVAGTATPTSLAVAIGGVLLVARSLDGVSRGLADLVEAAVGFGQVRDVLAAARRVPRRPAPETASLPAPLPDDPVLWGRGVTFRYAGAPNAALAAADLRVGARTGCSCRGCRAGARARSGR